MTNEPTDKLRALFLTALMVMSVFAFTVSFAGTAAAGNSSMRIGTSDSDAALQSGQTFWQGQNLFVVDAGPNYTADKTFQIRSVNEDDELTGLVTEFTLDDRTKNLSTSNLDAGEYVITEGSNKLVWFNGTQGIIQNNGSVNTGNISQASWEIAVQSLSAEFDDDDLPVVTGDTPAIEMDSNRGTYTVNISAEGLDEDDLEEIFNSSDGNNFVNASHGDEDDNSEAEGDADGRESVQVTTSADGTIIANFSAFDDTGDFTFDFDVNDTTAQASAIVNVGEEDVEIDFVRNSFTQQTGDEVNITMTIEDRTDAYLFVGGEDVNYLERIHIVDDNEDGVITVTMNTWFAGKNTSETYRFAPNGNPTNASEEDRGYSVGDDDAFGTDGIVRYNSSSIGANGNEFGTNGIEISNLLEDPLTAGDYDLVVSSSGDIEVDTDNNELSYPDEEDVATLNLQERSTDDMSLWSLPQGESDFDTDELFEELEERHRTQTIAVGDRIVAQVNASGLYGYVGDENMTSLIGPTGQGIYGLNFTAEQSNEAANQNPKLFQFTQSNKVELFTDPENDTFYVVTDLRQFNTVRKTTLADASNVDGGENYNFVFQVGVADNDQGIDYSGANDISESPYVDDNEEELVTAPVRVRDADAEFNGLSDGELLLTADDGVVLTGTTTVAPETNLSIRLRSPGNFLLTAEDVEPTADRTWRATFDLADIEPGTNFTATVRRGGTAISDDVDGQVLGAATASVTFNDQDSPRGSSVVVASVTMSRGGFVAIHSGSASGPVIGSSKFLGAGTHENVRIALDESISEDTTLVAMPHKDDNANNVYDFPSADAPYTADGSPVTDSAEVSYVEEQVVTRTVQGDTPTPMIMTRTVQAQSPTPREVERTVVVTKTATPGQPGFGVAIAVVALLAAALLAIRRRD